MLDDILADTHVDPEAVRAFGADTSTLASDLASIAGTLSSISLGPAALGPVGARFLASLADAIVQQSHAVAAMGDRLSTSHSTAYAAATAYEDADGAGGARISGV